MNIVAMLLLPKNEEEVATVVAGVHQLDRRRTTTEETNVRLRRGKQHEFVLVIRWKQNVLILLLVVAVLTLLVVANVERGQ